MLNPRIRMAVTVLRWCVGVTLLSAVADRFGLWGAPGTRYASWGDWAHFVTYSSQLNWYLPASLQGFVAGVATALEIVFGLAFVSGWQVRYAAYGATALFTLFALAMTTANGIKSPLNYSVFPDAGAAFMLAMLLEPPTPDQPAKA